MNAIDILKYGQQTILGAIQGFPEAAWETPGACGVWSVKDIIAHLASYEAVLGEVLSNVAASNTGTDGHYLGKFTDPDGQFNDTEVALRKEKSLQDVLGEFNDTHAQVMSLVTQISPETLRQTGTLPWYGMAYSLDDFLVYTQYGHKREHSAQIAAFRDQLR